MPEVKKVYKNGIIRECQTEKQVTKWKKRGYEVITKTPKVGKAKKAETAPKE